MDSPANTALVDATAPPLAEVALLLSAGHRDPHAGRVIAAAEQRARIVVESAPGEEPAVGLALIGLVSDCLAGLWLERFWGREDVDALLDEVSGLAGVPPRALHTAVGLELLRNPAFLALPPRIAIEAQLSILAAFAGASGVWLWTHDAHERTRCAMALGGGPSRRSREIAQAVLSGAAITGAPRLLRAVPVLRWQRPHAALVLRIGSEEWRRSLPLAQEAAVVIGALLERDLLLERAASRERALVAAGERRLARLAYDIHDGPVQQVAALAGEASGLRRKLRNLGVRDDKLELAAGRLDEMRALLSSLDADLRAICHSVESGTVLGRPLEEALRQEIGWAATSDGLTFELTVQGDVESMTDSQRIAIFRIVQECMSNVREHSGAAAVSVAVTVDRGHVEATVEDNGHGFDVERALIAAARRGRLGLVGLHERARLLGGSCVVTSEPGGPTVVSVVLPRWEPPEARPETAGAEPLAALGA